jgi:CBS domain containing-hemolysin-like protein
MDGVSPWALLACALLLLANAFFVASEFAIVKVRATRLEGLAKGGDGRARMALRIAANLDGYLSANQLGVTVASIGIGWLAEPVLATLVRRFLGLFLSSATVHAALVHSIAAALAFFVITYLHTVIGELMPKSLAIYKAERVALLSAWPLHAFYVLFYPLIYLLNGSARLLLRLFRVPAAAENTDTHTAEELKLVVAESHAHGRLDRATADLVDHALDFRGRPVRSVMTPRPDLLCLELDTGIDQAIKLTVESQYSRFPVLSRAQGRDRPAGFVHVKDLYGHLSGVRPAANLRQLVREPIFIPETMTLDRVRRLLQKRRVHVAFVLDEYTNFVGMVSLEDVLEELVGPIEDESDEPEGQQLLRRADGSVEVFGGMALADAQRHFDFIDAEEIGGIDTLGGYLFARLEHPPRIGDKVTIGRSHEAEVLHVEEFRVRRLLVRPLPEEPSPRALTEPSPAPQKG